MRRVAVILGVIGLTFLGAESALVQENPMTFFITSQGPGDGANLGGLAGADAHCQMLTADAGVGDRTWRAYLSTQSPNAVNARDRIGAATLGAPSSGTTSMSFMASDIDLIP